MSRSSSNVIEQHSGTHKPLYPTNIKINQNRKAFFESTKCLQTLVLINLGAVLVQALLHFLGRLPT
jgi:hypothetical protein